MLQGGRVSKASGPAASGRGPSPSHSQSRHSLHSGSSSSGTADSIESGLSLERLDESGYASQVNIAEMITNGLPVPILLPLLLLVPYSDPNDRTRR